jgi:hypothetical protein
MFEKIITFKASKKYIENNKDILPIPSKNNIPNWFKKINHTMKDKTIKGCMPFLDSLTAGYILKMPVDYFIEHNIEIDGEPKTGHNISQEYNPVIAQEMNLNYEKQSSFHKIDQLKGSPLIEKNMNLPVHKIHNPWVIKTPPGYSTLFLPPMNNHDDRFSIIPGIVDTDTFELEVNFPFIVNGDKYPYLKTLIKRGTPIVQVIPFKRDGWKMNIENYSKEEKMTNMFFYKKYVIDNYKKLFWNKKSWK